MAAGEGVMRNGKHIHLFSMDDAESFNSSHTVHQLSFGDSFPGMQANPLDGMSRIIDEGECCIPRGNGKQPCRLHVNRIKCTAANIDRCRGVASLTNLAAFSYV